jgi:hypothetical protein
MCGQACPGGASIGIADEGAGPFQPCKALMQATTQTAKNGFLRAAALAVSIAGTLFWLYTFYGIAQVPAGDGSGFQWIAVVPLGLVFFVFTFPPWFARGTASFCGPLSSLVARASSRSRFYGTSCLASSITRASVDCRRPEYRDQPKGAHRSR